MQSSQPDRCPPEKRKYVLVAAILASAMGFIDGSVIAVALPQIRTTLGADFIAAQWISNSYLLFLGALILLGGALGDQLGIKRVFVSGIVLFTVASIACAIAPTTALLIGFRAVQGAGAAIMLPGSMALISYFTPRAERGRAMGIWIAASAITTSMGPLLGGFVLTYGGEAAWRWIFALNLPLGLLTLAILKWQVPDETRKLVTKLSQLDWLGAFLLTLALAGLASGLTFLGETKMYQSASVLMIGGFLIGCLAIWWEKRTVNPMVEMKLFSSGPFSGANALTFLVWAGMGAVTFFLPMVLIIAWKLPPTYAGGIFLPFGVVIAITSPIAGRMADRIGARTMLTLGPVIVAAAFVLLAWAIAKHDYWFGIIPALLLLGCGIGISASPLSAAIVNSVSDDRAGAASGINNMVARLSNLFAVAGLGAFVSYVYSAIINGSDLLTEIKVLMISAGFGERLTGGLYQIRTVEVQVIAMDHAMIALCLVLTLMSLVGGAIGWFTQSEHPLSAVN